jgi:nicotinate phosphoribosyltransferase
MNKAMMIDFYELTMAQGYFHSNLRNQTVYFDLFFRTIPDQGGYALYVGLNDIIDFIKNLHFSNEDIAFLRSKGTFSKEFLEYLQNFTFQGDIYSFLEGEIVFPNVPLLTVKANMIEAQLIETYILQLINHQTLIATKASRIKHACEDKVLIEMGARRAHGFDSALNGTKAAYIGGIDATSNVLADQVYKVPSGGTMAHSWVQSFDSEYDAFKAYAKMFPNNTTLLVDTYHTLESGIPNAIRVIKEELLNKQNSNYAIRIDSGDLAYLSKKARVLLDDAGLFQCKIVVSNALDEYLIESLLQQNAPIDVFGVGERLITAKSDPVFGAVYKIVAKEINQQITPIIKISDNPVKITTPHFKKVYRVYENDKAIADYLTIFDETVDTKKPLILFDPIHTWKKKELKEYSIKEMHHPIFIHGELVYTKPSVLDIRNYAQHNLRSMWNELRRFSNPHKYYVDLSKELWDLKQKMMFSKQ